MVAPGNVDKHRLSMSGLKAVELEKWGRDAARARYGEIRDPNMKAPEQCYPQFKQDQSAGKTYGDVSNDWRRAANEDATTKPGFDHSKKRR